jgi:hypothetical protein
MKVNLRNVSYSFVEIFHWLCQANHQRQWGINVFCGMIGHRVVGWYVTEGLLWGRKHAAFISETLLLEGLPSQTRTSNKTVVLALGTCSETDTYWPISWTADRTRWTCHVTSSVTSCATLKFLSLDTVYDKVYQEQNRRTHVTSIITEYSTHLFKNTTAPW